MGALSGVGEMAREKYVRFYCMSNNSNICTINVMRRELELVYSATKRGGRHVIEPDDFVEYSTKGRHGVGHYVSRIRDEADIERALPHIRAVYSLKC